MLCILSTYCSGPCLRSHSSSALAGTKSPLELPARLNLHHQTDTVYFSPTSSYLNMFAYPARALLANDHTYCRLAAIRKLDLSLRCALLTQPFVILDYVALLYAPTGYFLNICAQVLSYVCSGRQYCEAETNFLVIGGCELRHEGRPVSRVGVNLAKLHSQYSYPALGHPALMHLNHSAMLRNVRMSLTAR